MTKTPAAFRPYLELEHWMERNRRNRFFSWNTSVFVNITQRFVNISCKKWHNTLEKWHFQPFIENVQLLNQQNYQYELWIIMITIIFMALIPIVYKPFVRWPQLTCNIIIRQKLSWNGFTWQMPILESSLGNVSFCFV